MTPIKPKMFGAEQDPAADRYAKSLYTENEDVDPASTPKVGYGNPPVETRFHPGTSGNPKGRPKGRKNLRTAVIDIFTKKMTVRIRDKPKRVTSLEAVFMTILNKALKGDAKAIQVVNATAKALGLWDHVPQKLVLGDDLSHFTAQELEEFDRLLTKASARTIPK